jgi:glycosyltransferase involved in cell wall biosynthesis
MKLIIQIPCFNEERTLPETYADLPRNIEGVDIVETLIIDDGSSDCTAEVARSLGVEHIVTYVGNKGLAYAFMAGVNACLALGADIIVNTDADNQYNGADIANLIRPILDRKADIVVGERPIDETEHFSKRKKRLQHIGSAVVRLASSTSVPDAPSGFRAYSREAALRMNVINEYTYTLETIIQAGRNRLAITSVPIRTNPETRKSRLFKSMWAYISRSVGVIFRSYMMYRPLAFFGGLGTILLLIGVLIGVRFLMFYIGGDGSGHIQSLILASSLSITGVMTMIIGLLADVISANRKLLEDVQYRLRKMEHENKV